MKVLYVGGMYQLEYSLHCELINNPNMSGFGCVGDDVGSMMFDDDVVRLQSKEQLEQVRDKLQPDICIFRSWNATTLWSHNEDLLLSYEINPIKSDGSKNKGLSSTFPGRHVCYQSQPMAKENQGHWFPYCVSKYYEKRSSKKDILVLVATAMPSVDIVGDNKIRSCRILLKGIADYDSSLVRAHILEAVPSYLKACLLPPLTPNQIIDNISRAKIWVSPTSVWYDDGCMSHKTIQGLGCGTLTITNNYPGMEDILGPDGENILYANTEEESLDKIKYYLAHDTEREKIALRGYNFVHNEYNWEKHIRRLYAEMHS